MALVLCLIYIKIEGLPFEFGHIIKNLINVSLNYQPNITASSTAKVLKSCNKYHKHKIQNIEDAIAQDDFWPHTE